MMAMLGQIMSRLDVIEKKVGGKKGGGGSGDDDLPESVSAFDAYCTEKLDPFKAAADALGGDAAEAGGLLVSAWLAAREVILLASKSKEPKQPQDLMKVLEQVSTNIKAIGKVAKRNEWEKHVKGVQEAAACLNFLAIKNPPPRDYVKSQIGSSNFHTDKVRREFRPSSATPKPEQIKFCDTLTALMEELVPYVKEYHTTGLAWNPDGAEAGAAPAPAAAPKANPASGGAAPPQVDMATALSKGGAGATAGLKHVDKKDLAAAPKPTPVAPRAAPKPKAAETPKGEAKCELVSGMGGAKWDVQYQSGICEVKPNSTKEMVYVYGCVGAGIDIQADCRNVIIEACSKTRVFLNSAVTSVEVVNCKRQYINVRNSVPTLAIDNSDNVQVFLSAEAMKADIEITTSKSSEMNVQWEKGEDIIEKPIPEQFKHKIVNGAVTVEVSDLYG